MTDEMQLGMLVNALHAGAAAAATMGLTRALQDDLRALGDKLDAQLSAVRRTRAQL